MAFPMAGRLRTEMSKSIPPPISDPVELRAYSAAHLVYELQMFFGAVRAVPVSTSLSTRQSSDFTTTTTRSVTHSAWVGIESPFRKNARIEVFITHMRNLIAFLYPDSYPLKADDVAAHHFVTAPDPWAAWLAARPALPATLRDAKIRADKELAHLTTLRMAGAPDEKAWRMADLASEVASILSVFIATADPSRLTDDVANELKRYGAL